MISIMTLTINDMSNYATLIASIQSVITQNGNNEITGTILQQTLLSMINSLGSGYQFVGIATPETNPGTPDQRVFYLASSGTYPNFGPATIPAGNLAVFYYDTSWHYSLCKITATFASGEEVNDVPIDNTNLNNPAIGALAKALDVIDKIPKIVDNLRDGGTDKALSAEQGKILNDEDYSINSKLEGISAKAPPASCMITDGYYISSSDGTEKTHSSRSIATIDVTGKKKVIFLGMTMSLNIATGYSFFDNLGNPVMYKKFSYDTSLSEATTKEYTVDVPEGAVTLKWTIRWSSSIDFRTSCYAYTITGDSFNDIIKPITENLSDIKDVLTRKIKTLCSGEINPEDEGYYINSSGVKTSSSSGLNIRTYYNINRSSKYLLTTNFSTSSSIYLVHYFNGSTYLGHDTYTTSNGNNLTYAVLTIPELTDTIKINVLDSGVFDLFKEEVGEYIDVNQIDDLLIEKYIEELGYTIYISEEEIETDYLRVNTVGEIVASDYFKIRVYDIDSSKEYIINTNYSHASLSGYLINYFNNDVFIGSECTFVGSGHLSNYLLTIPQDANKIYMNVRHDVGEYNLYEVNEIGYFDFQKQKDELNLLVDSGKKNIKISILSDRKILVRGNYDEDNDIIVEIAYRKGNNQSYKFDKNSYFPRYAYIGDKNLDNSSLCSNYIIRQSISDTVGPITMDWCGPIYANHGYCTPVVTIQNNPLTASDIGSRWHDQVASIFGSDSGYREYTIANVVGNKVYLLPVIMGTGDDPHRDWVYYNSTKPNRLTHISGGSYSGDPLDCTSARFDYQVCECVNFIAELDGKRIDLDKIGEYNGYELAISYQQVGYNPYYINFANGWNGSAYTINFDNVPIQVIFDRQFIISGCFGFLSYSSSHLMNVLQQFKLGGDWTGNPNGRYIGIAPTAFLKPIGDYESWSCIPKLKYQYQGAGTETDYAIDFRKEFVSNFESHPVVRFNRSATYCDDVDNMPERIYSYIKDTNNNKLKFGVAGGHSLVRGASQNLVRNTMIPLDGFMGWWNPPVANKLYLPIMKHGDDGIVVTSNYTRMNEGFFCWYKPQLTNALTGAAIHCFYYKSGSEYVVYIQTVGSHSKDERVIVPSFMDGMNIITVVEQKNNNIELLNDVVISGCLHIKVTVSENDETNFIVLKLR